MERLNKNKKNWEDTLRKIFPKGIPNSADWTKITDIISVLNTIGSINDTNHIFLPSGGVTEIKTAKLSRENGCIEIYTGAVNILKPKRLSFESFSNPLWSYFRIETAELKASGVNEVNNDLAEEIVEYEPGEYSYFDRLDTDEYEELKIADTPRHVTRYFKGSFLIFAASSSFNLLYEVHDPKYNKMSEDEFRSFIQTVNDKLP